MNENKRGTYFYNIQKMEEDGIDNYNIYNKSNSNNDYLFECYEEYLNKWWKNVKKDNEKSKIEYPYSFERKDKITTIHYISHLIDYKIVVNSLDQHNLNVKIFLKNRINEETNVEYIDFLTLTKEAKEEIINVNKYLNSYSAKEVRENNYFDKMVEFIQNKF
jgi:hypothetical protein